jgi:hypothetical protein
MSNKIQSLIISHLQKHGSLKILLPDNFELEIGTTQEDKFGHEVKSENYCYVIASKENKATVFDSFNLGIRFSNDEDNCVLDDCFVDSEGNNIRQLNVV